MYRLFIAAWIGCHFLFWSTQLSAQAIVSERVPISPEVANTYEHDSSLQQTLNRSLQLACGPVNLTIRHLPGASAEAQVFAAKAAVFLSLAEKALDVPLDPPGRRIVIHGKGGVMAGYDNINVSTSRDYAGRDNIALLYHELGHLWFGSYSGNGQWFDQGVVSFLPLALAAAGRLTLSPEELTQIRDNWGWRTTSYSLDMPLSTLLAAPAYLDEWNLLYVKSFQIQYLIMEELGGPEQYFTFLRALLAKRRSNDDDIVAALTQVKRIDWRSFLRGWVFTGPYGNINPRGFADTDGDGLADVEEHYRHTDPKHNDTDGDGYADGWELSNGYNPMSATSKPKPGTMVVDGALDHLAFAASFARTITRPTGTGKTVLNGLSLWWQGKTLWVRATFSRQATLPVYNTIHLRDSAGKNYWIQSPDCQTIWINEFSDGQAFEQWQKSSVLTSAVQMARGDVFEAQIDLDGFGITGDLEIRYMSGDSTRSEDWNSDNIRSDVVSLQESIIPLNGQLEPLLSTLTPTVYPLHANVPANTTLHWYLEQLIIGHNDQFLYLGARTRLPAEPTTGSFLVFHVRDPLTARNWWFDSYEAGPLTCRTFGDGQASAQWKPFSDQAVLRRCRLSVGPDIVAALPWELFGIGAWPERLEVKVMASGFDGKQIVWNAEEHPSVRYYVRTPEVVVDGRNRARFEQLTPSTITHVSTVPPGQKLDFNLATLRAGVTARALYVAAQSRTPSALPPDSIITCHLSIPDEQVNYWIQYSGNAVWVAWFTDGTEFSHWTTIKDRPATRAIELAVADELEIAIPLDAIPELIQARKARIQLYVSSHIAGKLQWDAVLSPWIELTK